MPVWVLHVQQGMATTVCGVEADELRSTPGGVSLWKDGRLVYQVTHKALIFQQECIDRAEALALMRQGTVATARQRHGGGGEVAAIRPGAGGQRQTAAVIEQVRAVIEETDRKR